MRGSLPGSPRSAAGRPRFVSPRFASSAYKDAVRIVSLVPSVTETLIDFGLAAHLVGITRFCIHPADVVGGIPKVGGTKDPKLDRIQAAKPDLIFLNEEENRKEDHEALAPDFRVVTSFPRRVDQVPADLRRIGQLCDVPVRAEARATALEAALTALRAAPARTFSFAYIIWRNPWMTLNADTYVSDLLLRAGGVNVYANEVSRYPEISLEDLAARRPDVVLLPDEPFPFKAPHADEIRAQMPDLGVDLISGDDACWHGVRSIRGVALARRLAERWSKS